LQQNKSSGQKQEYPELSRTGFCISSSCKR
jgi:hypothetical protein